MGNGNPKQQCLGLREPQEYSRNVIMGKKSLVGGIQRVDGRSRVRV